MSDSILHGFRRNAMVATWLVLLAACGEDKKTDHGGSTDEVAPTKSTPSTATKSRKTKIVKPKSYKVALVEGNKLLDAKRYDDAVATFQAALDFKPNDPRALSEISWAAFKANDLPTARNAAKLSIRNAKVPKLKAASLYNLGRIEEQLGNTDAAKRAYSESLALRPNKTVSKRLESFGSAPVTGSADSMSNRSAFENLARAVGRHYGLAVVALSEHNLDGRRAVEKVALLCAPESESGAYLIHNVDTERRWFIQFPDLDGRSALEDGAGARRCGNMQRPKQRQSWITRTNPWLEFEQTHSGGGAWCRVAIRKGRVSLLRYSYVNDARHGDKEEVIDYEFSKGPYPELAATSTEHCMTDIKVQTISADTVRALLRKR